MKVNLPQIYNQRNIAWGGILLGFNTSLPYNIHNYGCLITCLAMTASYYGKKINPAEINEKLKAVNGFAGGGNYVWNSIKKIWNDITEKITNTPAKLTTTQINEIKQALDSYYPVMLQIDMVPEDADPDMHYVLAVDYDVNDENNITIADPWTGTIRSLKDYLRATKKTARDTIEQYIIYQGPVANTTPSIDPLKECLRQHVELVDACNKKDKEIKELHEQVRALREKENNIRATIKQKEELIEKLNQYVNDRNNDIAKLTAEKNTLEVQVKEVTMQRDSYKETAAQVPSLKEQLEHLEQSRAQWYEKEEYYQAKIKELSGTSYATTNNKELIGELIKRLLQHVYGK